jgi:glucose-6-phosphate 1-dehydrogenase
MEGIVFSPELTVPDTLVLQNLADDIARHQKTKGAIKSEGDEGYLSGSSTTQDSNTSTCLPIDPSQKLWAHLLSSCRNLKSEN